MDKSITTLIFESIRPEFSKLVEDAVLSALSKMQEQIRRYPEMVNVSQAAEITGYSKNTLYQTHSRGLIPCAIKVGSKLMFHTGELREWIGHGAPKHTETRGHQHE